MGKGRNHDGTLKLTRPATISIVMGRQGGSRPMPAHPCSGQKGQGRKNRAEGIIPPFLPAAAWPGEVSMRFFMLAPYPYFGEPDKIGKGNGERTILLNANE